MAHTLGIDVGAELTSAGLLAPDGRVATLDLGDRRSPTASVIRRRGDGSVEVGDAAVALDDSDGELVADPLRVFLDGDPEPLRAVVAHVLGRATAALGKTPGIVGVIHPDNWDVAARDRLVAAIEAAGAPIAVAVSDRVAVRNRVDDAEPSSALALGAAVAAAASTGPIVTREDVAGASFVPSGDESPPEGPVSVFDAPPEPPPPEDHTAPLPVTPPDGTTAPARATGATPPAGSGGWANRQAVLIGLGAVVLVGIVVVGLLLWDASRSGDDTETVAPTSSVVTTSTTSSTTSTTTTEPETSTTTSTSTSSSTTSSTTTSTSTTTTSSTTTVPVPAGSPGDVTLVETGLVVDGTVLRLGDDGDDVLDVLTDTLGDPDFDAGPSANDFCFSEAVRLVRWGDLEVVIGEDSDGDTTFGQWHAQGADDPEGLVTVDGLGVGVTVAFLEVRYDTAAEIVPAFEGADEGIFSVTNSGSGAAIIGITTSLEPEGVVTEMWAGDECTRVFT